MLCLVSCKFNLDSKISRLEPLKPRSQHETVIKRITHLELGSMKPNIEPSSQITACNRLHLHRKSEHSHNTSHAQKGIVHPNFRWPHHTFMNTILAPGGGRRLRKVVDGYERRKTQVQNHDFFFVNRP